MRTIHYSKQFKKDYKRSKRQGKRMAKLRYVIELLAHDKPLPDQFNDHALTGSFVGMRECHINPDWLLIYAYEAPNDLILVRLGSHANLFRQ